MSEERVTVDRYLELPETNRPMELLYGVLREPPPPNFAHQRVLMRLSNALDRHVARFNLGRVCTSPIDVILDKDAALVLQPDLIFIATARLHIVKDRVCGAPDLTVEVLSPGTARSDRHSKLECYRRYGVSESWLVDPDERTVDVCNSGRRLSEPILEILNRSTASDSRQPATGTRNRWIDRRTPAASA